MIGRLLRKSLMGTAAIGEPEASDGAEAAPSASRPSVAVSAVVSPDAVSQADIHRGVLEVKRSVLRGLSDRVLALGESLGRQAAAPDVAAVLEAFAPGREVAIRQLPQTALKTMRGAENSSDVRQLVTIFESDPSLAQALLRLANSAAYGGGLTVCRSIGQAMQRVGVAGAQFALLQSSMEGMLCRPGPALQPVMQQVWTHMQRVAPVARQLSRVFGADPDEALTLGLLHDVGKLVVFDRIAALRTERRRELDLPTPVVSQILSALHESLGGLAILEWGLGDSSAWSVATHHRQGGRPGDDALAETIFLAERLDLAEIRKQAPDLDSIWAEGKLGGSRERAERLLAPAA